MKKPDEAWFETRPTKLKICPRCDGHGNVNEGYALAATDLPVADAPENAIRAFVVGSWDIFTACREALDIAKKSERPVAFEFNDQTVVVRANSNANRIARAWWRKQYGETPEESWKRR